MGWELKREDESREGFLRTGKTVGCLASGVKKIPEGKLEYMEKKQARSGSNGKERYKKGSNNRTIRRSYQGSQFNMWGS